MPPWTKPSKITSWSYSRYSTYKQCPLKAKLTIIDKLQEPKNAAKERGTAIHKMAEDYMNGLGRSLPKELKSFTEDFKELRAKKKAGGQIFIEQMWGYTSTWQETAWNNWTACWLRVKLDVAHITDRTLYIDDVKTGKYRQDNIQDYIEQQELYAVAGLAKFAGQIDQVVPRLMYVDAGVAHPPTDEEVVYKASDLPALKKTWEKRVKPMLNDQTFAPRPSGLCRYCHFRKENGGPCQY